MKIAIASGKGGTGKTLVSVNLFRTLQREGIAATLIDCDAEEPNVTEFIAGDLQQTINVIQDVPHIDPEKCTFCGKCNEYCSFHAIVYLPPVRFISVVDDLCHDCGACGIACKSNAITLHQKLLGKIQTFLLPDNSKIIEARMELGVPSPVKVIREAIRSAARDTLVILDSPPGTSCPFITTVEQADFVILVTEPTPFGFHDLTLAADTLRQINKPFGVVINKAGLGNNDVYRWLSEQQVPLLMEIPFDREIARIYSEGHLLVDTVKEFLPQFLKLYQNLGKRLVYD